MKSGICSELSGGQRPPRSLAPGNGFPDRGRLFEWRGLMVFGFWQPENRTGCGPGRKDGGHQAGEDGADPKAAGKLTRPRIYYGTVLRLFGRDIHSSQR